MEFESNLQRQLQWISAADGKALGVFAIDTSMLGVLAALMPEQAMWEIASALAAFIAAALLLVSIGGIVVATFPRTSGPKGSLFFFGSICEYDEEEYVTKLTTAEAPELSRDFARQIYRNAQIANTKYWAVRIAMISMFASVLSWLLAIYLLW